MTKFLEKIGFKLSFPMILLLIAILLYVILLITTRLPQDKPEYYPIKCPLEFNIAGIEIGCNTPLYQVALLAVLGLIVYGPFYFIFVRIFPVETITIEWMIPVIFSFSVYFLIDYLIKTISKKRKKYSDKSESFK